jgi:hypothetical protein
LWGSTKFACTEFYEVGMAPVFYEDYRHRSPRRVYSSGAMVDGEDTVLKGAMRDLGEASRRIRAARHLMREHALEENPDYLRLVARLSEALDVTEAAIRETRRLRDAAG